MLKDKLKAVSVEPEEKLQCTFCETPIFFGEKRCTTCNSKIIYSSRHPNKYDLFATIAGSIFGPFFIWTFLHTEGKTVLAPNFSASLFMGVIVLLIVANTKYYKQSWENRNKVSVFFLKQR